MWKKWDSLVYYCFLSVSAFIDFFHCPSRNVSPNVVFRHMLSAVNAALSIHWFPRFTFVRWTASDEWKIVQIKLIHSNEIPIKQRTINQIGTGCCQWTTKCVKEITVFSSLLDEWMLKTKKICTHTMLLKRFDDVVNVDRCVCTQNYGFRHMYFGLLHCPCGCFDAHGLE